MPLMNADAMSVAEHLPGEELDGDGLRLFTLNVSGPSLERAERLTEYLAGIEADVLVLTETRDNKGTERLIANLAEAGYDGAQRWCRPAPNERGVVVLSRARSSGFFWPHRSIDLHHRAAYGVIRLGKQCPVRMLAAYVPSRDASRPKLERKREFLTQMLGGLEIAAKNYHPVLLIGDLNIVSRDHEPRYGAAFRSWEYEVFDRLAELGLVDVFAELHPDKQAHSWIGRTGNGYRYDYVFMSRILVEGALRCEYLHEPREIEITDHAGLLLEVAPTSF